MDEASYKSQFEKLVQGAVIGEGNEVTMHFITPNRPEQPLSKEEQLCRSRMLHLVSSIWIKGIFEKSLHNATPIALGLQEKSSVLSYPLRSVAQEVEQSTHPLPAGTRILQVYNDAGGELLILGEPGAGKTTLLFELTRDLLARSQANTNEPLPVVFNLSSWAKKRLPLTEWLIEELRDTYNTQHQILNRWVHNNGLILLLDGLDEVAHAEREACIGAINLYHQEHSLVPVVVCSRSREYLQLQTQLRLQAAVMIQPLTNEQIDDYVVGTGTRVDALHVALRDDLDLQELATTPLMLSILTLAYQGTPLDEITALDSLSSKRQQVFISYIQRMLHRRGAETSYTPQQTIHWLAWLARKMLQYNQTQFYLEGLQPIWLANRRARITYHSVVSLLIGLLIGLFLFVIQGILGDWPTSPFLAIAIGLPTGLLIGLLKREIDPVEATTWTWRGLRLGLLVGSFVGIVTGILTAYGIWLGHGRVAFGLGMASFVEVDLHSAIVSGTIQGGATGLLVGLLTMLLRGFSSTKFDEQYRSKPNQGIWRSARNGGLFAGIAFLVSTISTLIFALFTVVTTISPVSSTSSTSSPPPYSYILDLWVFLMSIILLITTLAIPLIGFSMGGRTAIQHLILRLFLWRSKSAPWKYIQFLDYAAERILLRKVGGGYIFMHRLLLEYFASLETIPVPEKSPEQ